MSYKWQATGQINLIDEATGSVALSVDLSSIFKTITGASHFHNDALPLVDADGETALPLGTLGGIRNMVLWPAGGNITFRHGGNAVGIDINGAQIVQGVFGTPTVQTTSTTPITVRYLILE